MSKEVILAASILGADPLNLETAIKECEKTKLIDWVQVDVMDGHFTPNLSFGPATVKALRAKSSLFLDIHMMVEKPYPLIEPFANSGADLITVHLEAKNPLKCLKKIKAMGKKAGLALKPETAIKKSYPFLKTLDLLLVMTVNPGFAGQAFLPECLVKIKEAKELIQKFPHIQYLQVDGGINEKTIGLAARAGANVCVCGSALFKESPSLTTPRLLEAIRMSALAVV